MINLEFMIYVKGKLKINAVKWQGFFESISLEERFQFATFRPRGEGICYFLCRGTPQYLKPSKQQADTKMGLSSHANLKYTTREDKQLRKRMANMYDIEEEDDDGINITNFF